MSNVYTHYNIYTGKWPWKNFKPAEVACRHCGELYLHTESLDALQKLRELLGKPLVLTSGHRCTEHNRKVGGLPNSKHLKLAFDCVVAAEQQNEFIKLATIAGFKGVGRYPLRNFVHLDVWEERAWQG